MALGTPLDPQSVSFAQEYVESMPSKAEYMPLIPSGLAIQGEKDRPLLLLRSEDDENLLLPVPLNRTHAAVLLCYFSDAKSFSHPHDGTEQLLNSLGVDVLRCDFDEIKGIHQYISLHLAPKRLAKKDVAVPLEIPPIRMKAEEAMAICLHLRVPIRATKEYMHRSRQLVGRFSQSKESMTSNQQSFIL